MEPRWLLLSGALAVVLYVATTLYGAAHYPGYSHRSWAISELIARGAPGKRRLDMLFSVYNGLLVLFGVALLRLVQAADGAATGIAAAGALIAVGTAGLVLTLFFPMDPRGAPATFSGRVHLVLAGVISLGTMAALLLASLWLGGRGMAIYTYVSLAVVFVSGLVAAVSAARGSRNLGLWERVTIGGFLQWLFVISLWLYATFP